MRQVFSSPRLENVEGVVQLLKDAGIEVRVTHGRSFEGSRRRKFSYSDNDSPQPTVWVVNSADQVQARAILRDAGLLDTTRPGDNGKANPFGILNSHRLRNVFANDQMKVSHDR